MSTTETLTCQRCNMPINSSHSFLCALHDPDGGKDVDLFNRTLDEKITREEVDPEVKVVDLARVVFPAWADFMGRVFEKDITFAQARFNSEAHFKDAEFKGRANFRGVEFEAGGDFCGAEFDKETDFTDAQINHEANFSGAEFGDTASFGRVKFNGLASFRYVEFDGEAHFTGTEFNGGADFWSVDFAGEAYFSSAQFIGDAYFRDAAFGKDVFFTRALVRKGLYFFNARFPSDDSRAAAHFHSLDLESPESVRFEGVVLSRVSFLRTDISRIQFVDCTWPEVPDPVLWPLPLTWPKALTQSRKVIYDELTLDDARNEHVEHDRMLVAELYRQLRINLESRRQEKQAGDFYFGQMRMRRQDHASYGRAYTWLLLGYRVVARYGESYIRPFVWYAFILAPLFALGYWKLGATYSDGFFTALTAGALFQEIPAGSESWGKQLIYVNTLLGICLLGVILVAIGRHFRR